MSDDEEEEKRQLAEQREREENARKEKHRRMEEEREKMRQGIRDKYNIKKKDDSFEPAPGGVGRSRKPGEPAPLPGQPAGGGDESMIPKDFDDFKNKMTSIPSAAAGKAMQATEKCSIQ